MYYNIGDRQMYWSVVEFSKHPPNFEDYAMTTDTQVTISIEQLIAAIQGVASQAGSGATNAESAAGVGTRRTSSNAEQDSKYASEQVDSDTGVEEAHAGSVHTMRSAWDANVKRTYDEFLDLSLDHARRNSSFEEQVRQQYIKHSDDLNVLTVQHLQNGITMAQKDNGRMSNADNLSTDRMWNINETDNIAANLISSLQINDVTADVILAAILAAMGQNDSGE